jgi:bifunctional DNA-binding transcriptional regulator/antitoxin component of YhaV-PrlF toxin-antitoxin module
VRGAQERSGVRYERRLGTMPQAIVSNDYRIEIPEEIRREISLATGQKVHVFARNGVITLVPDQPLSALRGFLKGMNVEGAREKEDRF